MFISSTRDLYVKAILCLEKEIWSIWVGSLGKKARKIIVTHRTNAFLPVSSIRVKSECFVDSRYWRGYSSMVEHSAPVWEVPGSNPRVPPISISRKRSKAFSWAIVEEESKITSVTENRSRLPSSKFVCVQGLCALEFDSHRQHSLVFRFLTSACEVPASNKSLRANNNLKRLSRHSEQESLKHHGNIKEELFLPFMCKWVKTGCFVELWTTRRLETVVENSCGKKEYMLPKRVPQILYYWKCSEVSTWASIGEESRITMVAERRSQLPSIKFFGLQRLPSRTWK